MVDKHVKQLQITAYSKRWWSSKIKTERSAYTRAKRAWEQEQIEMKELKSSWNKYYKVLYQEKRECWENFLQDSKKELGNSLGPENSARCWLALRYTASEEAVTTPVIKELQRQVAVTVEKKEALF